MTSGKVSEEVQPVPEGGYGWVVVIVTFFIYSLMGMLLASFPVMYKEYMYAFDTGAVLVGSVLSCHVIFNNLAGTLFILLSNIYIIYHTIKQQMHYSYNFSRQNLVGFILIYFFCVRFNCAILTSVASCIQVYL